MRFLILKIAMFTGLLVLALALFIVQVWNGSYYRTLGDKNRIRLIPMEAPRGRVFDRNHRALATNRPSYDVVATPEDVHRDEYPRLSKLLGLTEAAIKQRMSASREYPFAPAVIEEDVSQEIAFKIEERRPELPGVSIRVSGRRFYPYQQTASHLIGFIGKINSAEYEKLHENQLLYGMNSLVGRMGLEKVYDEKLRGERGGRQIEVNARGNMVRLLSEKTPVPGEDLTMTIDLEFQKKIMDLIQGQHAAVAVLDLDTDELLALASSPSYDPNVFVSPGASKERLAFLKDEASPLVDRGVSSAYPPGSVFKLVTALAGLETGKITPSTTFHCTGLFHLTPNSVPRKCWFARGHGDMNVYEALERSCNVFFYSVGKRLSPDDIAEYARMLGLGEAMRLETSNIAPGLVPDSAWKKKRLKEKWYQGETLSFAIGQGYLLTSPVQILRMTSIIAKDGEIVEPHLIRWPEGEGEAPHEHKRLSIKKANFEIVKQGMFQVVQSDYGTGQLGRVDFGHMAAKTGTAQAPPLNSHAWMTGFFPYEHPKLAFAVFVEHGGSGGIAGARIVKGMLETWRDMYGQKVA
ncbi:MAG TPA: penicillin-binding protein 2 [Verrucomicrobiae bacterium]|jgi:penicillin-binding protein 2|nr:penicillin-binding protein 2 [Verrucomicrobiae bacterium]